MDEQRQDDQPEPTYNSSADTWCSPENLPEAIDDRKGWQERVRDIRADGVTWCWWWLFFATPLKCVIHFQNHCSRFTVLTKLKISVCLSNYLYVWCIYLPILSTANRMVSVSLFNEKRINNTHGDNNKNNQDGDTRTKTSTCNKNMFYSEDRQCIRLFLINKLKEIAI